MTKFNFWTKIVLFPIVVDVNNNKLQYEESLKTEWDFPNAFCLCFWQLAFITLRFIAILLHFYDSNHYNNKKLLYIIQYHKVPRDFNFTTFCYNRRKSVNLFFSWKKSYKWTRWKKTMKKLHLAKLLLGERQTNVMQKINITCKFCASKTRKQ